MIKKLLCLLVLLLTAVSGAWAQAAITTDLADSYDAKVGIPITLSIEASNAQYYQWYKKYPQGDAMIVDATSSSYTFTPKEAGETKFFCAVYGYNNDYVESKTTIVIATVPQTYSITLAEGTEDAGNWSVPTEAAEGTTVTVTYSGTKKVKSVKAVKKAAAPAYTLLSAAATSDVGKVVCAAGHLHDAKTAVPSGCTAVGILGKVTATGHGLILALQDATSQTWNTINGWTSVTTYASTTLKVLPNDDARGTNLTSYTTLGGTTVSNWAVAQIEDYDAIFKNLGSTKSNSGMLYDDNVNDYITTGVGGTALSGEYWSAAEYEDHGLTYNNEAWEAQKKKNSKKIRPVLGF